MTTLLIERKYSSDLTYQQWKILESYIPEAKTGGRPRAHPMWEIINAIIYRIKTGCQWRNLPNDYPPWQTVYTYFRNRTIDGTWKIIHDEIVKLVRKKKKR